MSDTDTKSVTFEQGYERLKEIAERLNNDEVPVHEMCELFAEGKGLEQALTQYLDQQKARIEAIERGEGIQPFTVVAPSADMETTTEREDGEEGDDEPAVSSDFLPPSDDDIPF